MKHDAREGFDETAPSPEWLENGTSSYHDAGGFRLRRLRVGHGKPLLLLHTMRTQADYFYKIIPGLAEKFEVHALDLPGHGHSDIPKAAYDEAFFTASVSRFIEEADLRDALIVGESIGGVVALCLGVMNDGRVRRIVSINPYDYGEGGGILRSSALASLVFRFGTLPVLGPVVFHAENRLILKAILKAGLYDTSSLSEELVDEFNRSGFRKGYRGAERRVFSNWKSWIEARKTYPAIKKPATLVYGSHDWSYKSEREDNRRLLPDCEFLTLDRCGHFASLDRPGKIVELISRHSE